MATDPDGALPNTLFIPKATRLEVQQWGPVSVPSQAHKHSASSAPVVLVAVHDPQRQDFCHPAYAPGKSLHQPFMGLLQPLTTPLCPWSHIILDFVTGLPLSEGNTIILTVDDRFSRSAHFMPLAKLLSAAETGELLVQHVFCPSRDPEGHVVRPGATEGVEDFLRGPWGNGKFLLWLSSTVQWSDGMDEPEP